MATSEATEIDLHEAVPASPQLRTSPCKQREHEDAILQWVAKVNDFIDKDSLDILKLSMRSELNETQRETIKSPASLFHALEKAYPNKDAQLARFIYALEKLGHRRYGWRAIRRLEEGHHPLPFSPSTQVTDVESFIFYQKLAVLCCILRKDSYGGFIAYFAKKCEYNPNKCEKPLEILIECVHRKIITFENHIEQIEDALIAAGLQESEIEEHVKRYNQIEAGGIHRGSETSSDTASYIMSPKVTKKKRNSRDVPKNSGSGHSSGSDSSSPVQKFLTSIEGKGLSSNSPSATPVSIPEEMSTERSPLLKGEHGHSYSQEHEGIKQQGVPTDGEVNIHKFPKKRKCLIGACLVVLFILLMLMAGAATLTGFGVKQYISHRTTTQSYPKNSSVILTESNNLFTESLRVMEDTDHPNDFDHDITIYQVKSKCSDIVDRTVHTISGSDIPNKQTFYALADSFVLLNVCVATNGSTETVRVDVSLNHPDEPDPNEHPYKFDMLESGVKGQKNCKNMSFDQLESNYYTLSMQPSPDIPMIFEYELTYNIRAIDSDLLTKHKVMNHTLHKNQDVRNFTMGLDIGYSCFIAIIDANPEAETEGVHIKLSYGNRLAGLIAGAVVLFVAIVLMVIVIIVLVKITRRR